MLDCCMINRRGKNKEEVMESRATKDFVPDFSKTDEILYGDCPLTKVMKTVHSVYSTQRNDVLGFAVIL